MAVMNKCCFCWDVRQGSLIVGGVTLALDIIILIVYIVAVIATGAAKELVNDGSVKVDDKDSVLYFLNALAIVLYVAIVVFVIHFILTIILIVGIKQDRMKLILPWLVWSFVFLVMNFVYFCMTVGALNSSTVGTFIINVAEFVFQIYCVLCVVSHYQNLKAGASGGSINAPPYKA